MQISVAKIAHFRGHRSAVFTLAGSSKEGRFFSGGADGLVVEWDLSAPGDGRLAANTGHPVYSLLAANDRLAIGTASGSLHIIPLAEGQGGPVQMPDSHVGGIFDLKIHSGLLITAGGDGRIRSWSFPDLSPVANVEVAAKSLRCMAFSPFRNHLAIGASDWSIHLLDADTFTVLDQLKIHSNSVFGLTYSPDGHQLASGGRDAVLNILDANDRYRQLRHIQAHQLQITSVGYSPDGKLLATASMDKTIRLWDPVSGILLKGIDFARHEGHSHCVNKLLWLDNFRLVSCGDDKQVMVWKIETAA